MKFIVYIYMHVHATVWLIIFGLLLSGIFLYLRGNMNPKGKSHDPENYRTLGLIILFIAIGLVYWLYTQEPRVHVYSAE